MIDLDAIKTRCVAATPGPWRRVDGPMSYDFATVHDANDSFIMHINKQHNARDANITFVVNAREDVQVLLDEVKQLREELEQAAIREIVFKRAVDWLYGDGNCLVVEDVEALHEAWADLINATVSSLEMKGEVSGQRN